MHIAASIALILVVVIIVIAIHGCMTTNIENFGPPRKRQPDIFNGWRPGGWKRSKYFPIVIGDRYDRTQQNTITLMMNEAMDKLSSEYKPYVTIVDTELNEKGFDIRYADGSIKVYKYFEVTTNDLVSMITNGVKYGRF